MPSDTFVMWVDELLEKDTDEDWTVHKVWLLLVPSYFMWYVHEAMKLLKDITI